MSLDATINLIGNIAIALSFIAALIFGVVQTRAAARDRRERFTLDALRAFDSREFAEIIYFTRGNELPKSPAEFEAMPENKQIILIQAAQQFESLGMLVYEKYIDLDLVDKTLGNFVSNSWEKLKPFFLEMRQRVPDPYLAEYFQWLAEQIDKKMKENRKPYYLR